MSGDQPDVGAPAPPEPVAAGPHRDEALALHHRDAWVAVVEKPWGVVVHPGGRHREGTLVEALRAELGDGVRLVHRLDRETSGLLVVALDRRAAARLSRAFAGGRIAKRYLALLEGRLETAAGEWRAPIGRDPAANPRWGVRANGSPALTRFQLVEALARHSLVELEPRTGRTNQLRLHAAHAGHPIVGDTLHGGAGPMSAMATAPGRLFLHATSLCFAHPATGTPLTFSSSLPPELGAWLDALRASAGR